MREGFDDGSVFHLGRCMTPVSLTDTVVHLTSHFCQLVRNCFISMDAAETELVSTVGAGSLLLLI